MNLESIYWEFVNKEITFYFDKYLGHNWIALSVVLFILFMLWLFKDDIRHRCRNATILIFSNSPRTIVKSVSKTVKISYKFKGLLFVFLLIGFKVTENLFFLWVIFFLLLAMYYLKDKLSFLNLNSERFFDDFRSLDNWVIINGDPKVVKTEKKKTHLLLAFTNKNASFARNMNSFILSKKFKLSKNGVINCRVWLAEGAIFNIIFRGNISDSFEDSEWYMSRIDTRGKSSDISFLKKDKNQGWDFIAHSGIIAPHSAWHNIQTIVNNNSLEIKLGFKTVCKVKHIASSKSGQVGFFNELGDVKVKKIRVLSFSNK